jgi:ADP-ribose pyrophosphatase
MQTWKTHSRTMILHQPPWLTVENHVVELPNGQRINDWAWIITPDFANVVVVDEIGDFLFFRQTKYGVNGVTLAPVGGYLDQNEAPLDAAKRELREEMAREASEWHSLGTFIVDGNRGAGTAHLFLALRAKQVAPFAPHDLEEQVLTRLTKSETQAALLRGEFKCLSWSAAVAMALSHPHLETIGR